jgi:hypothetical protein
MVIEKGGMRRVCVWDIAELLLCVFSDADPSTVS